MWLKPSGGPAQQVPTKPTARPTSLLGSRGAEPYSAVPLTPAAFFLGSAPPPSPPTPRPTQRAAPRRSSSDSAASPLRRLADALPEDMGEPSKELLDLPSEPRPPASFIESLLASRDQQKQKQKQEQDKEGKRKPGPPTDPLPKSQVLGKVKDFLGEIAKANQKLQLDTQNKPPEEYDIEALTGNEEEYIEMDLLLGVADLHSEQAVEAAEATMNGFQPSGIPVACSSSDSEDDSDDSTEDGGDRTIGSDIAKCKGPDEAETDPAEGKKPNKRQKIVVLN